MAFFNIVDDEEGGEYFREYIDEWLNLSVSVDGWHNNKKIQFVAGSKGSPTMGELMKKPGWVGRNITNRSYKEKAEEKGAQIVE